jgi:hypothetical protein
MKMTDMRAKARAIFGPAIAEPMPKQPNGAKALQERANARPIPTYKVGGSVKKAMPPQPTAAEREADRKRREEYAKMKVTPENAAAIGRGNRSSGYKDGGKVQTSADTAKKLATEMGGMKKGGKPKKDGLAVMIAIGSPMKGMKKPMKKADGGDIVSNRMPVQLPSRREMRDERNLDRRAEGGVMKPVKKAAGGAAKVRKGMMTPEGKITHAMNKIRGK